MSSIPAATLTTYIQQFLIENGIPFRIANELGIYSVLEGARDLVAAENALPTSPPPADSQQRPSSARDSLFGDHPSDDSIKDQQAEPNTPAPALPEADETFELDSNSGDSLFGEHADNFQDQQQIQTAQSTPAAPESDQTPELVLSPRKFPTDNHSVLDQPADLTTPDPTSSEASPLPESTAYIPAILNPSLASLQPSPNAFCTNHDRLTSKYHILSNLLTYLACYLSAPTVALSRAGLDDKALAIGQFALDLLGPSIFQTTIHHYETSDPEGKYDNMDHTKLCLAECVETFRLHWNDHNRMANKLNDILFAHDLVYIAPTATNAVLPKSTPKDGVLNKRIEKRNRRSSTPPVRGVARRVRKVGNAARARIVRAGYDESKEEVGGYQFNSGIAGRLSERRAYSGVESEGRD